MMSRTRVGFGMLVFVGCFAFLFGASRARADEASQAEGPRRTTMSGLGVDFVRYPHNPLTTIVACDPWDARGAALKAIPGAVHPSVLYFPDGMDGYKFWMVFTPPWKQGSFPPGAPSPPLAHMAVDWWWERCTLVRSNDGIHWEKSGDYTNPLIDPGEEGSWDWAWHCDPDLVYTPDQGLGGRARWFLYYCGCHPGKYGTSIGLAISDDGLHFRKVGQDGPLKGHVFQGDRWNTRCPSVIYDQEKRIFHMWHNWGSFEMSYATSTDGIHWTPYHPRHPGQWDHVVLRPTPGTFDACGITHQDVIRHEGRYWMYYYALAEPKYARLQIGLATSPDGIHWTKHDKPVLSPDPSLPWEAGSLYRVSPVIVGDKMYMYYSGISSSSAYPLPADGDSRIGLAFSQDDR